MPGASSWRHLFWSRTHYTGGRSNTDGRQTRLSPTRRLRREGAANRAKLFALALARPRPARAKPAALSPLRRPSPPMPRYDFRTPRLYVDAPLATGRDGRARREQTNYLRQRAAAQAAATSCCCSTAATANGWPSSPAAGKRALAALPAERLREQPPPADLHFLFAPLKHARLDYLVQKAVEMGVSRLQPVITRHTQVARVNLERMRANVIEAAQQCGVLSLPDVAEPAALGVAGGGGYLAPAGVLRRGRRGEGPGGGALRARAGACRQAACRCAVLIGPEGGFAEDERAALCCSGRTLRASRSGRASCAPTPRRWRRWRWCRRCWETGGLKKLRRGCRRKVRQPAPLTQTTTSICKTTDGPRPSSPSTARVALLLMLRARLERAAQNDTRHASPRPDSRAK